MVYQFRKGISARPALTYLYMIHRGRRKSVLRSHFVTKQGGREVEIWVPEKGIPSCYAMAEDAFTNDELFDLAVAYVR